jgi:hypothetical protein
MHDVVNCEDGHFTCRGNPAPCTKALGGRSLIA